MIKILADSTCDLTDEILKKYNISLASLTIMIEGRSYRDRIDLQPDEFYAMLETSKENPTTAMPSPVEFLDLIKTGVKDGAEAVLIICMSSGTSGSWQSAIIAKDMYNEEMGDQAVPVVVIDSKGMSHGSGYLIMKCAMLIELGMSFADVVEFCESYKLHVKHFLSVDDLDHLIRSGRLTNASAFFGKLLKLKPIMSMRNGKGAIVAKERGRKNVLEHYVSEFMRRNDSEMTDFIIVGYTSDKAYAENLKQKLILEAGFVGEIYIMQMGMSVGTHVGLGGLSMFFIEKDRLHDGIMTNQVQELRKKLLSFQGRGK